MKKVKQWNCQKCPHYRNMNGCSKAPTHMCFFKMNTGNALGDYIRDLKSCPDKKKK